ncbi:DUF7553 family protein [Haloarcula marina]|uniref:DUF7553 family protein n=1 Tax=Haloarcula marina TaxID=2961574 RepID=UPI0020B650C8|nr:hypothetical protein [Halomicroarcula marina]
MNRHFKDTRYYLKRAVETAGKGVREELTPLENRARAAIGREKDEQESTRLKQVKTDVKGLQQRVGSDAEVALTGARSKIDTYRQSDTA